MNDPSDKAGHPVDGETEGPSTDELEEEGMLPLDGSTPTLVAPSSQPEPEPEPGFGREDGDEASGLSESDWERAVTRKVSVAELGSPHEEETEKIGRFRVLRELGRGGMGRVLRAHDPKLRRTVALKISLGGVPWEEGRAGHFMAEAQVTGQLEHPSIVPLYDLGEDDEGHPFFVMKEIEGRSLEQLILELRTGPPELLNHWSRARLLRAFVQVCNAVAYAHSRGVLHRDIKPGNIMLGRFGEVMLVDWGVARLMGLQGDAKDQGDPASRSVESITRDDTLNGAMIGSPGYMAPEQAEGDLQQLDSRADVFSLGATLYEVLCWRPAYEGPDVVAVVQRAVLGPPQDPRERAPEQQVPEELAEICLKAMASAREDRFQSASDLAEAVDFFLEGRQQQQRGLLIAQRAEQRAAEGREMREKARGLREEVEVQFETGVFRPEAWQSWDEAGELLRQAALLEVEAEDSWRAALIHAPKLAEAHRPLAERRAQDLQAAVSTGDAHSIERAHRLLQAHLGLLPNNDVVRCRLAGRIVNRPVHDGFFGLKSGGVVGRETELDAVRGARSSGARLITLVGTAGVGKTRLSKEYGLEEQHSYSGGVWFADLSDARDARGIAEVVGSILGVSLLQEDPVKKIGWALRGRGTVLLVLDNFEQVVDQAAETVGRWLELAPQLQLIVTSRISLGLGAETSLSVGPLSVLASVELFCDRARAQRSGFLLTESSRGRVLDIVQLLDCLPLAIELAAARIGMLTVSDLSERLAQRFELLRAPLRAQGQETLEGAIEWSWQLMNPPSQAVLAQCSIFRGGFDLSAAEAVLDISSWPGTPPVLDLLEALCEHHLVRRKKQAGRSVRYSLFESVRAFAARKLEQGSSPNCGSLALRHAAFYARLGTDQYRDSLYTHGGIERLLLLHGDRENLLAGLESSMVSGETAVASACALAACEIFMMSGPVREGQELLSEVLVSEGLGLPQKMRLLGARARLLRLAGNIEEALEEFEAATALAAELGDRKLEGRWIGDRGALLEQRGSISEAAETLRAALGIAREVGDRRYEAIWLGNLGMQEMVQGLIPEAVDHTAEALAIAREMGHRRHVAIWLGNLGLLHREQGRILEAVEHTEAALAITRELGDRRSEGNNLGNLGDLLLEHGDWEAAGRSFEQAISIGDDTWPVMAGVFRGSLALVRARAGKIEESRALLARGEEQLRGVHFFELGKLLCKRGRIEYDCGQLGAAGRTLVEVENIASELGLGADSELDRAIGALRALID